jgi:hypothetical protein
MDSFCSKHFNNDGCAFIIPPEDDYTDRNMLLVCVIKQNINTLILVLFVHCCGDGHASTSREIRCICTENDMKLLLAICGHYEGLLNVCFKELIN